VLGAILALLMIGVGLTLAIHAAKYGFQTPGLPPPLIFLVVPFFDIVVFSMLVSAAFYYRQRPDIHKRLMVVATISILPPAFAAFQSPRLQERSPSRRSCWPTWVFLPAFCAMLFCGGTCIVPGFGVGCSSSCRSRTYGHRQHCGLAVVRPMVDRLIREWRFFALTVIKPTSLSQHR
jgi:hypothetical protein